MLPLVVSLALAAAPTDAAAGTYRVQATARLSGVPLLGTLELRGDVVLRPGDRSRAVRARLASGGHVCELAGTLAEDGTLAFAPGQRCPIALDDPGVRGHVEAALRSGRGRVADGRLSLDLELRLSGNVRISTGGVAGLPAERPLPVDGDASIRAQGRRDNSRAAEAR